MVGWTDFVEQCEGTHKSAALLNCLVGISCWSFWDLYAGGCMVMFQVCKTVAQDFVAVDMLSVTFDSTCMQDILNIEHANVFFSLCSCTMRQTCMFTTRVY